MADLAHELGVVLPVSVFERAGREQGQVHALSFCGQSFIADPTGAVVAQADDHSPVVLTHTFDLAACAWARRAWGVFRDRRPDLYGPLQGLDGALAG